MAKAGRKGIQITYQGVTDSISGWSRRVGIKQATVAWRIHHGMSVEEALTKHPTYRDDKVQCRRTKWQDCFNCPYEDCIESKQMLLEDTPGYWIRVSEPTLFRKKIREPVNA